MRYSRNHIFRFKANISKVNIPSELNNPFGAEIPEIAKLAATEFQGFLELESPNWDFSIQRQKGKMFGVLVVQNKNDEYCYLGTVSGKLPGGVSCTRFVPSIFDESHDDFFMNRGMTELTLIGTQIKSSSDPSEINMLKEKRSQHSIALQQRLFEHYNFVNLSGEEKSLFKIFEMSSRGKPPSAAGECAAPKLLQYAIKHNLRPIALAEFWWGNPGEQNGKTHSQYYPACKDRCRPILEYMLEDLELFANRQT